MGWVTFGVLGWLLIVPSAAGASEEDHILESIKKYEQPHQISAALCWTHERMCALVKRFSENGMMIHTGTEIKSPPPNLAHRTVFLLDLRCENATAQLRKMNDELLFQSPYKSVVLLRRSQWSDKMARGLRVDSDVTLLFQEDNGLVSAPVSRYWTGKNELTGSGRTAGNVAPGRLNVRLAPVRICYVITDNDTVNHLSDYRYKQIDTITKVNFILTNHLVDFLNGSGQYSFVNTWGYKNLDDGSWNGMIGQLVRDEADVGGSPLFFTPDRIPVIDYIAMPTPTRSKFVFRQPKLSYLSNVFVLPFRTQVWTSTVVLVFILIFFLYVASKWEWKKAKITNKPVEERPRWSDAVIVTLGAVCQQGTDARLKSITGRCITLLLFLSLMFLYTSYSANIVALLQSSSSRIKTLSDLLDSRLKLAVHDTVFNRYYFSTATEPVRKAIYQKKIAIPGEKPRFISLDEGVKKLRGGLFAFHMETGVGYKVVSEIFHEGEKCGLQEIQYLQVIDPWLAVQKNSSYKELFKIGFRRIQEHGLQARENRLLYTKKPECAGRGSNFVSVSIVDCRPALIILAYGGLAAFLIAILENLHNRVLPKHNCTMKQRTTLH